MATFVRRGRLARSEFGPTPSSFSSRAQAAVAGGLQPYVSTPANDAAVAEMAKQGFSVEQARSIVANATKSQEEAFKASAAYVATEANRLGVRKLVEAGYSEEEAKKYIAMGKSAEQVIATLGTYASMKLDDAAVKVLTDQGISRAEAQALVAIGLDQKSLLAIVKNDKTRTELLKAIDGRLKSVGIDVKDRALKGLGLTDADVKTAGQAIKAAQDAYKIYAGVSSAIEAYSAYHYFAGRWSEGAMSDASLGQLIEILDRLGRQNEEDRLKRLKQLTEGITGAIEGAAGIAAFFGPIGLAVSAVLVVASKVWTTFYTPKVQTDGNDNAYAAAAKANAQDMWNRWSMVPPSFNTRFYTLQSYRDTNERALYWLDQSEKERPWREKFVNVLQTALTPQIYLNKTQPPPPVQDLAMLGWIPFSFFEWAGGANLPTNRFWSGPSFEKLSFEGTSDDKARAKFDVYPINEAADEMIPQLLVGGEGLHNDGVLPPLIFANRAATLEARNQSTFSAEKLFEDDYMNEWAVPGLSSYGGFELPRNVQIQSLICDRMATAVAIMIAVSKRRAAEPIIEFAVAASRYALGVYGWQPKNAAKRLRDMFLGALEFADKQPELLGGEPKYT